MSAAAGQGAAGRDARGRSRTPLMVGIGCATAAILLWLAATAGGVAYLALERRAAEASTETFDSGRFSFDHPVGWFETPQTANAPHPAQVVALQNDDQSRYVTVLDMQGTMTAEDECAANAELIDAQGFGSVRNDVIGDREVAGRDAVHHRAVSTGRDDEFSSSVIDTWCIQKPDGVVLFVAQAQSDDPDPVPMPEAPEILDSWQWSSADAD